VSALLLTAIAALALGTFAALVPATARAAAAVQLAGTLALAAGAVLVLARGTDAGAPFGNGLGPSFGLDGLSAFFLIVVCLAAVPALLAQEDALADSPVRRPTAALTGAFLLALVGVLAARDAVTFLAFWELMTLVPAAAILVSRRDAVVRNAVFVYLAITHLGGVGVWIALLTLAHEGAIGASMAPGGLQALVLVAALIGFGTKAGLVPLHAWLPRAHPVAPAHLSALMSGVMVKVALYGLIRVVFWWLGPPPLWAGLALLAIGALSALGGILYALVQRELKRLLAFSTIENVGIIALALGASLVLAHAGQPLWATVAFAAALLHVANHAAIKTLLFVGAGAFTSAVGALHIDHLGGLLRRMPWTGWPFLVGCAAMAGAPVLNAFVSEWLALQSLLHLSSDASAGIAIAGALSVAALGATTALALYAFVKVVGLVLLGAPRTPRAAEAVERPVRTRVAMVGSAGACVALALLAGLLLPVLARLAPGAVAVDGGPALDLPSTGGLRPIALVLALTLVAAVVWRLTAGGARRAQPTPAWTCGQAVRPALAWTSAGFAKPLRLVLEVLYRPQRESDVVVRDGVVQEVSYRAEVPHLFDTLLYRPLYRGALRGAAVLRRLQSGHLRWYLVYLAALVVVLLALVRLGALS
jgi:hydrogenase-4 component B